MVGYVYIPISSHGPSRGDKWVQTCDKINEKTICTSVYVPAPIPIGEEVFVWSIIGVGVIVAIFLIGLGIKEIYFN